jgi:serine/threonine-protein kinase
VNGAGQTNETGQGRAVGRYVIYDQMAAGGTARVHLARRVGPEKFSRIVVMKGLKPVFAVDAELRAMLRDEAWLAARISHPNVVPVIDVESEGDEFWLALEYVHGETLTGLTKKLAGKPMPAPIAGAIFTGVLHGLHAAHELCDEAGHPLGLVHRDVSPQNIIVGVDGVARVLDFGIAKALGRSQATRDGEVKGKIAYMAPEQIFGEQVTRRTDVFATAAVMWEALTGKRLFLGETESETIVRVGRMKIEPPSSVASVPKALDEVVSKGLDREAEGRFETARDMALAIERATPLASAREVGEWVEELAGEMLTKRKAMIARIEREAPQSGEVWVQPKSSQNEVSGRRMRVPRTKSYALLVLILLVGITVFFGLGRRTSSPQVATSPATGLTVKEGASVVEPSPPVVHEWQEAEAEKPVAEPQAPDEETTSKSARSTHGEGSVKHRAGKAAKATDSKPDCDPPYVVDAQGHKKFRVECL